jgi:hypothetical protein
MTFASQKFKELFSAPRSKLIWSALILFFVGAAICSFNPPADSVRQTMKGVETMNSKPESQKAVNTGLKNNPTPSETETATFALG